MQISRILFVSVLAISVLAQAECLNTENKTAEFLSQNRQECLKKSRYLLPAPSAASENFRTQLINPVSKKEGLVNGSVVHCRYVYQKQNGASAKFRCARTNDKNQLFDSKGRLVPDAVGLVSEGDDVYLSNQNNEKITEDGKNGKVKALKAHILKVRYQTGDKRNVENYTSSAASRIFWAMGVPAHSNYMIEKVVCFGCGQQPFRGQQAEIKDLVTEFVDAAIEIKFDGERLYGPTQQPWKWSELLKLQRKSPDDIKVEIDVLALASQFVGAIGKTHMQNAIVCTQFNKENPAICDHNVAMAHDLGAAFGTRTRNPFSGGDAPRGNLSAFENASVFNENSCTFAFSDGGRELPEKISNKARVEFLKRAESLTRENLMVIFAASHMGRLHNLKQRTENRIIEARWADAVLYRIKEIQNAPCR